jgi:hypothetical protein
MRVFFNLEMIPIIYHTADVKWQQTKGHYSVNALSENSGLAMGEGVSQAAPCRGCILINSGKYTVFKRIP